MAMKINKLEIENVKRVKAVKIEPTAKVHCFTILTQSKNYTAIPTKE